MAKKAIRWVVFLGLLIAAVTGTYKVLSWKDTADNYLSSMTQLYSTEKDTMDVVFVGSSHCYCGINPAVIWEEYGISSFDMAISGQDKDSAYHSLVELLKTQSPEVVYVDLFAMTYDRHQVQANVYRNMLAMKPSLNSYNLVRDYGPDDDWVDYVLRWPIWHTRYRELKNFDFETYKPSIYCRGENMNMKTSQGKAAITAAVTRIAPLSEKNASWLNSLYELSKEHGFKLGFLVLPFYFEDDEQEILNGAAEFAREKGLEFIDFNNTYIGLDYNTDFCDIDHCNYSGAYKISQYLGQHLNETYDLADHRGDADYSLWDQDYAYYQHIMQRKYIQEADLKDGYFDLIRDGSGLVVALSLNGDYQVYENDILPAMDAMGISREEYLQGGKWVFEDGVLVARIPAGSSESFILELGDYDTLKVENLYEKGAAGTVFEDLKINRNAPVTIYNGLAVRVYDKYLEQEISVIGYN